MEWFFYQITIIYNCSNWLSLQDRPEFSWTRGVKVPSWVRFIGIQKSKEGIGGFDVWAINMDIEISKNDKYTGRRWRTSKSEEHSSLKRSKEFKEVYRCLKRKWKCREKFIVHIWIQNNWKLKYSGRLCSSLNGKGNRATTPISFPGALDELVVICCARSDTQWQCFTANHVSDNTRMSRFSSAMKSLIKAGLLSIDVTEAIEHVFRLGVGIGRFRVVMNVST